ncbi:hypothetical protein [Roseobacter ponti]|uniref:Uncharacterized protein n=1 Tax=Roseobacter ponti TaxID=1891787 RepID=A0A858SW20_9RHOB|nr:hypothetical protein [Roseobacter ponti]QJF52895.1 hypothetical protein G3256_17805 [Roseobacter ponti]
MFEVLKEIITSEDDKKSKMSLLADEQVAEALDLLDDIFSPEKKPAPGMSAEELYEHNHEGVRVRVREIWGEEELRAVDDFAKKPLGEPVNTGRLAQIFEHCKTGALAACIVGGFVLSHELQSEGDGREFYIGTSEPSDDANNSIPLRGTGLLPFGPEFLENEDLMHKKEGIEEDIVGPADPLYRNPVAQVVSAGWNLEAFDRQYDIFAQEDYGLYAQLAVHEYGERPAARRESVVSGAVMEEMAAPQNVLHLSHVAQGFVERVIVGNVSREAFAVPILESGDNFWTRASEVGINDQMIERIATALEELVPSFDPNNQQINDVVLGVTDTSFDNEAVFTGLVYVQAEAGLKKEALSCAQAPDQLRDWLLKRGQGFVTHCSDLTELASFSN